MEREFVSRDILYKTQFLLMCSIGLNIGLLLGFVLV
jgi:hypothetical protein